MNTDIVHALREVNSKIDRLIEALAERDLVPVQALTTEPVDVGWASHRRLVTSDFPKVGGRDLDMKPTDFFLSRDFEAFGSDGKTRALYAAGCSGLCLLSKEIKIPLFKVSSTGPERVWARSRELRSDRYAAVHYETDRYVEAAAEFSDWFPSHLHVRHRMPSANSPVHVQNRSIVVELPKGLSCDAFDRAFDAEVRKGSISDWVMTDDGRNHCALVGVDPARFQRFTRYVAGTACRFSPADEIASFSFAGGADRLVAIAEHIVVAHCKRLAA